ncbi:MAG: type II toxin-antitoxin system RelE/ParE family toxin [Draconibacterium sp.]
MTYRLKIHPFAEVELRDAQRWYNLQKEKLGDEFISEIEEKLKQISITPKRFRRLRKDVRIAVLKRFPYSIVFSIEGDCIEVYAFFHQSRNPKVWDRRIR